MILIFLFANKKIMSEDGFITVQKKTNAQRQARIDAKKQYFDWCKNVWPKSFNDYYVKCMDMYKKEVGKKEDETEEIFENRCKLTANNLRKKYGDCGLNHEICISKNHHICETNRQRSYEVYKNEIRLREMMIKIKYTDQVVVKPPTTSPIDMTSVITNIDVDEYEIMPINSRNTAKHRK